MNKWLVSMSAAAVAAGAMAVESANTVGVLEFTSNASGNTMMAPTFLKVGTNSGCTLADLSVTGYSAPVLVDEDEGEYEGGCGGGDFILYFLNSNGSYAARYYWIDDGDYGPGWFSSGTGAAISGGAASISIPAGQGVWVLGRGLKLRCAGQVADAATSMQTSVSGNTACGNNSPANLTLANLTVTGYDAPVLVDEDEGEYEGGCGGGDFILYFLNSNGTYAARYYWIDDGDYGPGWFSSGTGAAISGGAASVSVPAGQGLWALGRGLTLVIPSAL